MTFICKYGNGHNFEEKSNYSVPKLDNQVWTLETVGFWKWEKVVKDLTAWDFTIYVTVLENEILCKGSFRNLLIFQMPQFGIFDHFTFT